MQTSCTGGTQPATGCSGCSANQVCCKQTVCTPVVNPIGSHDSSSCTQSVGWACDGSDFNTPITVGFYADGPPGTGTFIGSTIANQSSGVAADIAAIAAQCGGHGDRRFYFNTPDVVKTGAAHTIYAYAINTVLGSNVLLPGTPKSITCTPPNCTIQGYKTLMPGNQVAAPASGQTVTLDGVTSTTAEPYFLSAASGVPHTVAVTKPAGYTVGYTLCYNATTCHTGAPTMANFVSINMASCLSASTHYADLWWHYYPPTPVNGVCNATHYLCNTPAASINNVSGATTWTWQCPGSNGGTTASCVQNKPINGVCGATHYLCNPGTSVSNVSGPTSWTWGCNGLYGGTSTSPTACSQLKPIATINVRAVQVLPTNLTCAAAHASATALAGTVTHRFTPGSASNPAPKTQVGAAYAQFTNLPIGTYTVLPSVPANYTLALACYTKTGGAPFSQGMSAAVASGNTLTWDLGYTNPNAWAQTSGGEVYAADSLTSAVPPGTVPRLFVTNGSGGYPGVATYGQAYDFDGGPTDKGETFVSAPQWLVHETGRPVNYYLRYYRWFGGKPLTVDYVNPVSPIAKPPNRTRADGKTPQPYYVTGDMTTSGTWIVGAGETLVFFVDGDLTIAGPITVSGDGFAAFVVSGNIAVDPGVGEPPTTNPPVPVVEGVYISNGTFQTGTSTSAGHERFVGRGTFVAGSFILQRDLDPTGTTGANNLTSAELFLYNPQFLLTMPQAMKEHRITWKEVEP